MWKTPLLLLHSAIWFQRQLMMSQDDIICLVACLKVNDPTMPCLLIVVLYLS